MNSVRSLIGANVGIRFDVARQEPLRDGAQPGDRRVPIAFQHARPRRRQAEVTRPEALALQLLELRAGLRVLRRAQQRLAVRQPQPRIVRLRLHDRRVGRGSLREIAARHQRGCAGLADTAADGRSIRRRGRAKDELDRAIDRLARRILVVDDLERVVSTRIVEERDRRVLDHGRGREPQHLAVDGRTIESGANQQDRQIGPEPRDVRTAVVHDRRRNRRLLRLLHDRQRSRHVAGAGVDRDPFGVDAKRRTVRAEMRDQRFEVLREALHAEIRQDRDELFRSGDFGPGLIERIAALGASRDVEEDDRRQRTAGCSSDDRRPSSTRRRRRPSARRLNRPAAQDRRTAGPAPPSGARRG